MKLIVCLDDRNGMLFNKRRQSSDRRLRERVLALTASSRLWMNAYSAKQFTEAATHLCVDDAFVEKAMAGDYCFVENTDVSTCAERVEEVIVYRWNRVYPSDTVFPWDRFAGACLERQTSFKGFSHTEITEEVYTL